MTTLRPASVATTKSTNMRFNIFDRPARQRRSNPDEYNARGVTSAFVQEIEPGWVDLKYDVLPEVKIRSKRAQNLIDSTEPYGYGFAESLEEWALKYIRAKLSEQSNSYWGVSHMQQEASARRANEAYRTLLFLFADLIGDGDARFWTPPQWARHYIPAPPPRRIKGVVTAEDLKGLSDEEKLDLLSPGWRQLDEDEWPYLFDRSDLYR